MKEIGDYEDIIFPTLKQTKQPYKMKLPRDLYPKELKLDMTFMGHYEEQNLVLTIDIRALKKAASRSIMYEMVMDSQNGNW